MKHLFIWLFIFTLSTLACGMEIPKEANRYRSESTVEVYEPTAEAREMSTVVMVVTADEGLNIRVCPGVNCLELDHDLHPGEIVTCDTFQAPMNGDGLWCHHERGWSNVRWMEAVK